MSESAWVPLPAANGGTLCFRQVGADGPDGGGALDAMRASVRLCGVAGADRRPALRMQVIAMEVVRQHRRVPGRVVGTAKKFAQICAFGPMGLPGCGIPNGNFFAAVYSAAGVLGVVSQVRCCRSKACSDDECPQQNCRKRGVFLQPAFCRSGIAQVPARLRLPPKRLAAGDAAAPPGIFFCKTVDTLKKRD